MQSEALRLAPLALPGPSEEGRLRRTVAETLCTHYESPHSLGMPAELLDEYEEIPGMDLNGLLPPLPQGGADAEPLPSSPTPERGIEEEPAASASLRPSSFRRNPPHSSASSSRPTTAGEEPEAEPEALSRWAPNHAPPAPGARPPSPPPLAREPSNADPSFTLALKRASESANVKSATAPALGHRRWSKSSEEETPRESPRVMPSAVSRMEWKSDEAGEPVLAKRELPPSEPVAPGTGSETTLQRGFSDLAISFASLDESMCDVNDYFILYYEGHGTVLRDPDFQGTHDEAFVLVDPSGKASPATLLLENDFASLDRSSDIHYTRQH
eukprot:g24023.t1